MPRHHHFETVRAAAAMLPDDLLLVAEAIGFREAVSDLLSEAFILESITAAVQRGISKGRDARERGKADLPTFSTGRAA